MYTSDINRNHVNCRNICLAYLAASVFCAVFGAVYEIFSHGVYSAFMVGAFLIPLLGGFLPFLLLCLFQLKDRRIAKRNSLGMLPSVLYHCGIITLTIGSIMTGVLEIYGTTNRLLSFYWIIGALLLISGILTYVISLRRMRPTRQ